MTTKQTARRLIENRIRERAQTAPRLEILEAGCGRAWPFDLTGIDYHITGIDLDGDALEVRRKTRKDLDVAVVGDLQTASFPPRSFDVIYCSFVLEHIEGVDSVLKGFADWVRPGGLVIITIPDGRSVYGFVTRMTPHWFHVLYKRFFTPLGRNAGKPGFGPYRTYYDPTIAQPALYRFCESVGLAPVEEVPFGSLPKYQQYLTRVISALSMRYLKWQHVDLLYIFRSKASS